MIRNHCVSEISKGRSWEAAYTSAKTQIRNGHRKGGSSSEHGSIKWGELTSLTTLKLGVVVREEEGFLQI